jgi:SAM-dependent methyltransferase
MMASNDGANWRDGYVTALDYTAGVYPFLFPEHLNYTCVLHGVEPPTLKREYNYFELGCGRACTVGVLAASNPQARFFANDFMPSHVAEGRQRASDAGLDNLTLLEDSFEALADGGPDLPMFDYITMQGVYTWVSPQARQQIVRFIARRLKPGGVVAVGYNAMPGWAASAPLQRLMQGSTQWSNGDGLSAAETARALVQQLGRVDAENFQAGSAIARRLAQITAASPTYLQHEYLNRHWQPMYHADIAEDFGAAKLDFAGSAMLPTFGIEYPPEQQALLDAIPDPAWRETAKDFLLGTSFRTDVFVRGRRSMPPGRRQQLLGAFSVALTVPAATVQEKLAHKNPGLAENSGPVLARLSRRACRLDDTEAWVSCGLSPELAQPLTAILSMNRHATLFQQPAARGAALAAHAWNAAVAAQALQGGPCIAMASPVTGGSIDTDVTGLAVYRQLLEHPDAPHVSVAQCAVRALQGISVEAPEALHMRALSVLEKELPIWRLLELL